MKTSRIVSASLALLAVLALVAAPAAVAQDTGEADLTRFVALGDSLSQGYSNGGVYQGVQVNSVPALIARQAGVTDFEQPLISAPGIPGLLRLAGLVPPTVVPRAGNGQPLNLNLQRPYNNLAVSGFDVRDVVVTRTGNPLIDVTLRGLGTALEQAAFQQPTMAFVWLGSNDVLGAATSGIVIDGVTLTRPEQFAADLQTIVGTLQAVGADIVMGNIPDVTAIPFVSTLAPVVVNPATQQPVRDPNGNLIPLIGPNGPLGANDRVLLSASTELAMGKGLPPALGGTGPLSNSAVLSADELALISSRVRELNQIILSVANQSGAAFFDVNAFFNDIVVNGYHVGGITLTPAFLTGGIFSYDGVHPTPIGYAVVANGFIDAINARYNAEIPPVNLTPFLFGPDGAAGALLPAGTAVQSTLYTEAAETNLRNSLRVPPRAELERGSGNGNGGGGPIPLIPNGTRMSPLSPIFEPAVAP